MSDQNEQVEGQANEGSQTGPSRLQVLKQRAKLMGINFSNNISEETLAAKINAKLEGGSANEQSESQPEQGEANGFEAAANVAQTRDTTPASGTSSERPVPTPEVRLTPQQEKAQRRQNQIKEQMRLVRCRIQNLDPKKANLPGEIFTVGNRVLGTVRKFVPYGEVTDDGYHLPYIIYQELQSRRFLNIRTVKDRRTGVERADTNYAKEFAIEVLPPLTPDELAKLAAAQKAAGSID